MGKAENEICSAISSRQINPRSIFEIQKQIPALGQTSKRAEFVLENILHNNLSAVDAKIMMPALGDVLDHKQVTAHAKTLESNLQKSGCQDLRLVGLYRNQAEKFFCLLQSDLDFETALKIKTILECDPVEYRVAEATVLLENWRFQNVKSRIESDKCDAYWQNCFTKNQIEIDYQTKLMVSGIEETMYRVEQSLRSKDAEHNQQHLIQLLKETNRRQTPFFSASPQLAGKDDPFISALVTQTLIEFHQFLPDEKPDQLNYLQLQTLSAKLEEKICPERRLFNKIYVDKLFELIDRNHDQNEQDFSFYHSDPGGPLQGGNYNIQTSKTVDDFIKDNWDDYRKRYFQARAQAGMDFDGLTQAIWS